MATNTNKPQEKLAPVSPKKKIKEETPATSPDSSSSSKTLRKTTKRHPDVDQHHLIAEAAYFIAEQRGFTNGNCEDDWYKAERFVENSMKGQ